MSLKSHERLMLCLILMALAIWHSAVPVVAQSGQAADREPGEVWTESVSGDWIWPWISENEDHDSWKATAEKKATNKARSLAAKYDATLVNVKISGIHRKTKASGSRTLYSYSAQAEAVFRKNGGSDRRGTSDAEKSPREVGLALLREAVLPEVGLLEDALAELAKAQQLAQAAGVLNAATGLGVIETQLDAVDRVRQVQGLLIRSLGDGTGKIYDDAVQSLRDDLAQVRSHRSAVQSRTRALHRLIDKHRAKQPLIGADAVTQQEQVVEHDESGRNEAADGAYSSRNGGRRTPPTAMPEAADGADLLDDPAVVGGGGDIQPGETRSERHPSAGAPHGAEGAPPSSRESKTTFGANERGLHDDQDRRQPVLSLLFLVDVSGSMAGAKLEAAKQALEQAADRALGHGKGEVAVFAFSGDCDNPITARLPFTSSPHEVRRFVGPLAAGGGTPLATALDVANRYIVANGATAARTQMIVLLGDVRFDDRP